MAQGTAIDVLADIRTLLIDIRSALQQVGSQSSFEIKTSARGVDLCAKAYAGSPIGEVQKAAIEAYFDGMADVQRRVDAA